MESDSSSSLLIKEEFDTVTDQETNEMFHCTVCPGKFGEINEFKKHIRIHSGEELYDCEFCDASFTAKGNLKIHMLVHTGERNFKCEICNRKFATKGNLKTHMLRHTGEKHFSCLVCNKYFAAKACVINHLKKIHKTEDLAQIAIHPDRVKKRRIRKPAKLNKSQGPEKNAKIYQCKFCDLTFKYKRNMDEHISSHADEEPSTSTVPCTVCPKIFDSIYEFKKHIRIHSGEQLYDCDICNATLTTKGSLKQHMLVVHTDERNYKCEFCSFRFKTKSHLGQHMLRHTGEKPFTCLICKKSFTTKIAGKNHLARFHGTEDSSQIYSRHDHHKKARRIVNPEEEKKIRKTYNCKFCEFTFRDKRSLKLHLPSHGERPYKCFECGKSLKNQHGLDYHMQIHTGEKKYQCEICPKKCRGKSTLRLHMLTHTNERPFICSTCGAGFKSNQSLRYHVKTHDKCRK